VTEPAPAPSDLSERYGAPAPWRRPVLIAAMTALALVFLAWVAWVAWSHGTPAAESELVSFEVVSDSSAVAHIDVQLEDDVEASCRVRAFAEDHTTVGEISFTPVQGSNDVEIRTERRATSIDLIGCTTPDQERPR
jgi:Domain of unknown function (DUF4307)